MNMDKFNIFDIDFDNVIENLKSIRDSIVDKYTDFVDGMKRYDLNTDEGYESFITDSAELRKDLDNSNSIFAKYAVAMLDKLVEHVMKEHENKPQVKKNVKDEIVNAEVKRNFRENNVNIKKQEFDEAPKLVWPSSKLTDRQARKIWRWVDKYVDEMVLPYTNETDEEVIDNMSSGLFEFAAWLLNAEEE